MEGDGSCQDGPVVRGGWCGVRGTDLSPVTRWEKDFTPTLSELATVLPHLRPSTRRTGRWSGVPFTTAESVTRDSTAHSRS